LHPEAVEEPISYKESTSAEAVWDGRPDTLRRLRLAHEAATLRAFAGQSEQPVNSVYPLAQLCRLQQACDERQVALVVCVQPASGQAGWVGPVTRLLGAPPVLLDGGQRPTPFVTLGLLADPVHVNREGGRRVTRAFHAALLRRQILK